MRISLPVLVAKTPVAPVTDQIHDHVTRERLAILERHLSHAHDSVQIFPVDVKNGNPLALGQG